MLIFAFVVECKPKVALAMGEGGGTLNIKFPNYLHQTNIFWAIISEGLFFFPTPLLSNLLICTYFNYPIYIYIIFIQVQHPMFIKKNYLSKLGVRKV